MTQHYMGKKFGILDTEAVQTPRTLEREAFAELSEADDAWHAELVRQFGKAAGDVRYTHQGMGPDGSELRRLHDQRQVCLGHWDAALERCRCQVAA